MEVIVLGGSGTFPRAGGACNGFLVRHNKTAVLLDMGTGVLSRLYHWMSPGELDALVITHLHPDHFLDIYPYRYFLEFLAASRLPMPVYAPAGAVEHIQPLFNEADPAKFDRVFSFEDLASADHFRVGSIDIAPKVVSHLSPTYGLELTCEGKRVFYTSDTAFDESLVGFAQGVDLLIAETTLLRSQMDAPVAHMATTEVGQLARRADVKRLVLSHLWPHLDRPHIMSEVKAEFDGRIDLAEEGLLIKA